MSATNKDSVLVDGEDSSEEEEDDVQSTEQQQQYDAVKHIVQPLDSLKAAVQNSMLPNLMGMMAAQRETMQELELLLRDVHQGREDMEAFVEQELKEARDDLRKLPHYEAQCKSLVQDMSRLTSTVEGMLKVSGTMASEVSASVQAHQRRRRTEAEFEAAGVADPVAAAAAAALKAERAELQKKAKAQSKPTMISIAPSEVRDGE